MSGNINLISDGKAHYQTFYPAATNNGKVADAGLKKTNVVNPSCGTISVSTVVLLCSLGILAFACIPGNCFDSSAEPNCDDFCPTTTKVSSIIGVTLGLVGTLVGCCYARAKN